MNCLNQGLPVFAFAVARCASINFGISRMTECPFFILFDQFRNLYVPVQSCCLVMGLKPLLSGNIAIEQGLRDLLPNFPVFVHVHSLDRN